MFNIIRSALTGKKRVLIVNPRYIGDASGKAIYDLAANLNVSIVMEDFNYKNTRNGERSFGVEYV